MIEFFKNVGSWIDALKDGGVFLFFVVAIVSIATFALHERFRPYVSWWEVCLLPFCVLAVFAAYPAWELLVASSPAATLDPDGSALTPDKSIWIEIWGIAVAAVLRMIGLEKLMEMIFLR